MQQDTVFEIRHLLYNVLFQLVVFRLVALAFALGIRSNEILKELHQKWAYPKSLFWSSRSCLNELCHDY